MSEIWLPVREFPEHYEVSNLGRLRRTKAYHLLDPSKVRVPQKDRNGYICYMLSVENRPYLRSAHRMVADAFLGPIPAGKHVNHKNGDKADSRLENLELVSVGENRAHSYRVLGITPNKKVEGNGNAKLNYEIVDAIRAEHATGGVSHPMLAAKYGVSRMTILRILNNRAWREEDRPATP